jgi:Family of unknown function (DUF5678)
MATSRARQVQESLEDPFVEEEHAFRRQHRQLLQRYRGQFVALYQGRVVGHGPDDEELAREVFERFGDVPFYIAKVEKEPTVYELPSPEITR